MLVLPMACEALHSKDLVTPLQTLFFSIAARHHTSDKIAVGNVTSFEAFLYANRKPGRNESSMRVVESVKQISDGSICLAQALRAADLFRSVSDSGFEINSVELRVVVVLANVIGCLLKDVLHHLPLALAYWSSRLLISSGKRHDHAQTECGEKSKVFSGFHLWSDW